MADPTQRVTLGKTKLQVSRLSLGGAPIGRLLGERADETVHDIVHRAYELGIRTFDTAPLYGSGASERRLGRALAQLPRDEIVVATKVGRLIRPDETGTPRPNFDFSYDGVMHSVDESLERLGLDRVDILHIHDADRHYDEAMSGAYQALIKLRREGVIGAVGAGMNQQEMPARFAREGDFDCFLLAGRYTLLDQVGLKELLPLCIEKRIGIIVGGVYNSGILVNPQPGATFNYRPAEAPWLEKAQRLQAVCQRHETPLMAAAIQFPLAHPAVATVLTGVQSVAELEENERMFRFPVPEALWQDLRGEGLLPEAAPMPGSE
jgi:D-threo-aldose 1-dehydrogenase